MIAGIGPSLQTALEHQRTGDLDRAATIYREVLRADPRHADALHLLGVLAFQQNQQIAAVDYIGQAIDVDPARPEYHNSLGSVYRSLGRPVHAMDAFRQALRLKPDFSEAYNNLGIVLADEGQDRGAIACFEQAAQLDSRNVQAWTNLGSALADLGNVEAALRCFETATAVDPSHAAAHERVGQLRLRSARLEQAIVSFETVVALAGDSPGVLKELAAAYLQVGRSIEAEQTYRRAIDRSAGDPSLLLNFAQALKDQGKLDEAIEFYRRGIEGDPNNGPAHYALGRALHAVDRFAEAGASYERSLALGLKDAKAAYHLGNARKSLKQLNPAVEAYRQALAWDPEFVPALYQLGNAYRQLMELDAARDCLEKVLDRKPGDLTTLVALGNVLKEQDDLPAAAAAFRRVIGHLPQEPLWELWLATLCPTVFHSSVGIDQYRDQLLEKLTALADCDVQLAPEDVTERGCPPPYNLQFHGRDDRPIKEAYARIFGNCDGEPPRPAAGKPRIGFVVTDGHEGVFLRYLGAVLRRLNRGAFDPRIICSPGGEARIRSELPAESIETFVIPSRFDQAVARIREGRFAVLYHWEVGSDVTNYFLPFFRLAPIQCTGAGVPVTTGVGPIDYFLSSECCEPAGAASAYTERLIRSRSLLTMQQRMRRTGTPLQRGDFGVRDDEHFYLCPHKIEKLHPDFDDLIGEILVRDPRGVVVIPSDRHGFAARKLHNRLRLALPHVVARIRFVPYQTLGGYFELLEAADVLLDPIYYGGGLTSFDGLSLDKPIVTLPGEFVRGRYTLGFYRTLGVEDCVAQSADEYAEIAVRLATERDWRTHVVERIRAASDRLFETEDALVEYNRIFGQLVEQALRRS